MPVVVVAWLSLVCTCCSGEMHVIVVVVVDGIDWPSTHRMPWQLQPIVVVDAVVVVLVEAVIIVVVAVAVLVGE